MSTDNNLQFIREKINTVKSAIMYSMSNELIKIPNCIVEAVEVDNEGQLWFICKPPVHQLDQCETSFPARLHFYRKGTFFHIEVSGKATIVNNVYTDNSKEQSLLIKMTMSTVEYTEPQERKRTKVETMLESGYRWLLRTIAIPHDQRSILSKMHTMNRA
jgi:general stress protein 26